MSTKLSTESAYDPLKMISDYLVDHPDTSPDFRNILVNRLGDQIKWYDRRSTEFKKKWERNRWIVIVLSASVPFLVGLMGQYNFQIGPLSVEQLLKWIVGLAGVGIAIIEGFNVLYKRQELFLDYRRTAELLRQEFVLFVGKVDDYSGATAEAQQIFVRKIEAIMADENIRWVSTNQVESAKK
jgi:hypothetical protein